MDSSEPKPVETAPAPQAPPKEAPPAEPVQTSAVFLQFVVFPLIIVLVAIAIAGFFTWAAEDRRTYPEYLAEIASGWKQKRAQAAYELLFRLTDTGDELRKTADVPQTIAVFVAAKKSDDPRIRRSLAVVLGFLGSREAVPALLEAVSREEADQETRLNATEALGRCHDAQAVPVIVSLLDDPFDGQRMVACHALGELNDPSACEPLVRVMGHDAAIDVRWNAALSLARLKDRRAIPTLDAMLDRTNLARIQKSGGADDALRTPMDDKQREDVMINALRGVHALGATEELARVSAVADSDPSYKVRDAAMQVRDILKASPPSPQK